MTVRVEDWTGQEIAVGTHVMYGAPDTLEEENNQRATVIEIGDPDVIYNPVTDADDGGLELEIKIKFDLDGTETTCRATPKHLDDHEEVYEETGDLVVIKNEPAA